MGVVNVIEWAYVLCDSHIQNDWVEQWIGIKFCVKLELSSEGNYLDDSEGFRGWCNECRANKSVAQTLQKCSRICWKWPISGRPATSRTPENVGRVQSAINKYWWLMVWELASDLGIPNTTVSKVLMQDLGLKHIMTKFILRLLLPKQKEHCGAVANSSKLLPTNQISSRKP